MTWLDGRTQHIINSVRAVILLLVGFGVVDITSAQLALLVGALESVFATITAKTTVDHSRVDTIVDKRVEQRVEDILTTPPGGGNR